MISVTHSNSRTCVSREGLGGRERLAEAPRRQGADTFDHFDLQFDWRIAPGGHSGVKYLVMEDGLKVKGLPPS
jgi:hypothetical protein